MLLTKNILKFIHTLFYRVVEEMDEIDWKTGDEYVLPGTLILILGAVIVGFAINSMLGVTFLCSVIIATLSVLQESQSCQKMWHCIQNRLGTAAVLVCAQCSVRICTYLLNEVLVALFQHAVMAAEVFSVLSLCLFWLFFNQLATTVGHFATGKLHLLFFR